MGVLATCGIRQPELACENFSSCFLLLADPSEEEYNLKPDTISLLLGTLTDLARGKFELVAENALLRQQVIILRRQVKRPACTKTDSMLLVLLASMVRTWKQALFIVQEDDEARAGIVRASNSSGSTSPEQLLS